MLRTKLVLLGLAAVFIVSAVASSSAFAAAETRFSVENKAVTTATNVVGTSGPSQLESVVAGAKILIECEKDTFKGTIEELGKSKGEITFEGCKVFVIKEGKKESESACTVPNIKFSFKDQLVPGNGATAEEEFSPASGTLYVAFEITGASCLLKGKYEVKTTTEGKGQRCALPAGEIEQEKHEVDCTSTGSGELRFGTEKVSFFSTDVVLLESKKVWRG
jgi:hypothetical protein